MTSRDAKLNVLDSSASKGQHGSKVLQSDASVCHQPKAKREDKEAENELHVGGLRRPSQTLYLVLGWESTGRQLWDCIDTALSNDTDASGLTRETVVMPKPSFALPSNVRAEIPCGVMRAAGDPDANTLPDGLVLGAPLGMDRRIGTTGVFPAADKPDKEDPSPTPDVSEQLTVGGGTTGPCSKTPKMRTENSKGIVQLGSLWISTKTRSSVSSRKVT